MSRSHDTLYHEGVLVDEAVRELVCQRVGLYVDCTVGGGDHSLRILRTCKGARVLGIDRDFDSVEEATGRFSRFGRISLIHGTFGDIVGIVRRNSDEAPKGILFDLGVSLHQLAVAERGFSFQLDAPLDMRADRTQRLDAAIVLNTYPKEQIASILWKYGEYPRSRGLAGRIVEARPLRTTFDLRKIVEKMSIPCDDSKAH